MFISRAGYPFWLFVSAGHLFINTGPLLDLRHHVFFDQIHHSIKYLFCVKYTIKAIEQDDLLFTYACLTKKTATICPLMGVASSGGTL